MDILNCMAYDNIEKNGAYMVLLENGYVCGNSLVIDKSGVFEALVTPSRSLIYMAKIHEINHVLMDSPFCIGFTITGRLLVNLCPLIFLFCINQHVLRDVSSR